MSAAATLVVVVFRTPALDLGWVPAGVPVVVVHNDDSLDPASVCRDGVLHLHGGGNVGFGAAVNAALQHVTTPRVVICNPDMELRREHWDALTGGDAGEVVVVPLCDGDGLPTSVVNRYPTAVSLLLSAYRAGRLAPRNGRLRRILAPLLGGWGRTHTASLQPQPGSWSLDDHWASGAALSVDTARLRSVGGFDTAYFLYYEDVDLCRRLAERHPEMRVRMAGVAPAMHAVGGSAQGVHSATEAHRFTSARRYCRSRRGLRWRLCDIAMVPRELRIAGAQRAGR